LAGGRGRGGLGCSGYAKPSGCHWRVASVKRVRGHHQLQAASRPILQASLQDKRQAGFSGTSHWRHASGTQLQKTEAARPWERKRSDRLLAVEGRRSNRGRRVTSAALPAHKLKPRPISVSWLLRHSLERGTGCVVTEKKRKATAKDAKSAKGIQRIEPQRHDGHDEKWREKQVVGSSVEANDYRDHSYYVVLVVPSW